MEAILTSDVITFDTDFWNADTRFHGYNREIPLIDDDETADPSLSWKNRLDETPTPGVVTDLEATSAGFVAPGGAPAGMAWDATPKLSGMATPTPKRQRSRWDETPVTMDRATPTPGPIQMRAAMTPEQYNLARYEIEIEDKTHPLTDEELNVMFPQERYMILEPVFSIPEEELEQKERKIMKLLLKVKNGTPPQRETAIRQITDKAREFGSRLLFNRICLLLLQPTLEDQDKHLYKVIDRLIYKLDELVRPYVHKILLVIEALLIDEDYHARVEGREIISNLSKAAGLDTMIAELYPDIDNYDEYVRNATARVFSVVASAIGIPALLPILKAVCQSKKSWQARHTGIKMVQETAILIGCGVLPHLRSLVEIIEHGLNDEYKKVRTITALSLAALAEAAAPYGIESFDSVLKPLLKGIQSHRGNVLAAFLKAIGFIIPLMDAIYASYYTKELIVILAPEFQESPDEELKKIVLDVVKKLHVL